MSLLTALTVKNSHILTGIYFIFLKICSKPNLKVFRYQVWTSVKSSEKKLSCKNNFTTFFPN